LSGILDAETFARFDSGMGSPRLHIVLLNPEIPQNTGNIGRTVAAIPGGCRLHIVHPISFEMTEKAFRRAGLDYWQLVDCVQHASWEQFLVDEKPAPGRLWLYTTKSVKPHWEARFREGDYLLFGKETTGAPSVIHDWVAQAHGEDHRITLPMNPDARSLNLSTVVCTAAYEALRQFETG
jgi:tRNA (cytidine/uridine-2'-O-)-methyltransferase